MKASDLRDRQRPLKDGYRRDPSSALTAARAEVVVDLEALTSAISIPSGTRIAGLHPATGGRGGQACSADLLLEALVACAGVTLAAVATAMSVDIRSVRITADGTWDARGTLGVDREAPVGMTAIAVSFDLDTDADDGVVSRLLELTERYCVIAQTLVSPPPVSFVRAVG